MRHGSVLQLVFLVFIFLLGLFLGQAVYAGGELSGPGSEIDPLVTRSFFEQQLSDADRQTINEIQQLQLRINQLKKEIQLLETYAAY